MYHFYRLQIIGWSADMQTAFENTRYLNDKYQLDGFDPTGFGGISLCYGRFVKKSSIEKEIFGHIPTIDEEDVRQL